MYNMYTQVIVKKESIEYHGPFFQFSKQNGMPWQIQPFPEPPLQVMNPPYWFIKKSGTHNDSPQQAKFSCPSLYDEKGLKCWRHLFIGKISAQVRLQHTDVFECN